MSELKPKDMPKETDNLIITCIDFRFHEAADRWLESQKVAVHHSDWIVYPGSSAAIADGTLIEPIKLSHRLHRIKNIYIGDHTDCGGFGGLKAFGGEEQKEIEAHFESIERAKAAIAEVLPQVVVISAVIDLEGNAVTN